MKAKKFFLIFSLGIVSASSYSAQWQLIDINPSLGSIYGDMSTLSIDNQGRYLVWFKLENQKMFKDMSNVKTVKMRLILDCRKNSAGISAYQFFDKKGVLLEKKDKISANNEYWLPRPYDFFAGVTAGFCKK